MEAQYANITYNVTIMLKSGNMISVIYQPV